MHGCDMDIFLDISFDDVVQQNAQSDDKVNCVCVRVCVYAYACVRVYECISLCVCACVCVCANKWI